ncbi:MAG: hypothetical protein GY940_14400 [bacterium]|nr:hypothetical protein [bacterium]
MRKLIVLILLVLLMLISGYLFCREVVPLPGLGKPDSLTIDDRELYITDQGTIIVYSLEDFTLKRKFGQQGEGPGEFKILPFDRICLRIAIKQDTILVNSISRLSFFTRKGNFLKHMFSQRPIQYLKPLGDKMVGYHRWMDDNVMYIGVYIYDPQSLRRGKELFKKEYYLQFNRAYDPTIFAMMLKGGPRRSTIYHPYGNKLFVEGKNDDILVFDNSGEKRYTIPPQYEKIRIPETFKKAVIAYLRKRFNTIYPRIKRHVRFRNYFPIRSFLVVDDKIYVLTFKNIGEKSEFYVLDLKGTFLEKKMIPFAESEFLCAYPYTIDSGVLYQLNENPDTEEWELRITNLNKNLN